MVIAVVHDDKNGSGYRCKGDYLLLLLLLLL